MIDATILATVAGHASQTSASTWALILGLGGVAFGGGGAVSLYKARSERSKNNADAARIITDAATSLIQPLQSEIHVLSARVATLEAEQRQQHRLLVDHSVWDHLAITELARLDVDLPPIPPLFAAALAPLTRLLADDAAAG